MPVNPSWLVALGICVAAALPQNLPPLSRRLFMSVPGTLICLGVIAWLISGPSPVLGIALILLWGAISIIPGYEPFVVLQKSRVQKGKQWLSESILQEDPPDAIQEKTETGYMIHDKVVNPARWGSETAMDEHPAGIQERTVPRIPEVDDNNTRH